MGRDSSGQVQRLEMELRGVSFSPKRESSMMVQEPTDHEVSVDNWGSSSDAFILSG